MSETFTSDFFLILALGLKSSPGSPYIHYYYIKELPHS